jgi:hypothetical protein
MLLSPSLVHNELSRLLGSGSSHTAMLMVPHGQAISFATNPSFEHDNSQDEPDLDEPERMRLLLGLASQWQAGDPPRVECEVRQG